MTIYVSSRALPYVYKLTHKETGQFYFGYRKANAVPSSDDLGKMYFTSSNRIKELGFKNFLVEIIAEFYSADDAYDFEQFCIQTSFRDSKCLNAHYTSKGKGRFKSKPGPQNARIFSEEAKKKLSNALLGKKKSEETRKRMSAAQKGKIISEKQRREHSLRMTGRVQTPESNIKRSKTFLVSFEDGRQSQIITGIANWCISYSESIHVKIHRTPFRRTLESQKYYHGVKLVPLIWA